MYLGGLNKEVYQCVTKDIRTDDVIITARQIEHIKEQRPGVYEKYGKYIAKTIQSPDYIIEANRPNTALILKYISEDNVYLKTVLRLAVSSDAPDLKNSVITFIKTDDKEFQRLLRNKKTLYKSE